MADYILSNANRFYTALETAYGQAAAVTAANRFPAVRLQAHQLLQIGRRLDKTGTRTYLAPPTTARRQTAFEVQTYLTSWNGVAQPAYGPLFQAALGGAPQLSSGLSIAAAPVGNQLQTTAPHGLAVGSGVSFGGELRFVNAVVDPFTFTTNAVFSSAISPGAPLTTTITYGLGNALPSVTLYDYWDPVSAVSRIIAGAGVDTLEISLNGDYHEFAFAGPAADLLDSSSFVAGEAGLAAYPAEPALGAFDYSIVPGHLGEVWLGSVENQVFTLTGASVEVKNNVALRNMEFGSTYPRALAAAMRDVAVSFSLFAQDDDQTAALYAAAKQRSPISAMLQLGQTQGELMGVYFPAIVPEVPDYKDNDSRLQWEFKDNFAYGVNNDEFFIAFA